MVKRIVSGTLLMIIFSMLSLSTFAKGKDTIYSPSTYETSQFLVNVTRPEVRNETTYNRIYLVCGTSENRNLKFEALYLDEAANTYRAVQLVGDKNSWHMYEPGVFAEQLYLPKTGANQIRIVAYYADEKELVRGKNLQISDYTITLMEKSDKNLFSNGFQRIANMLGQLFR